MLYNSEITCYDMSLLAVLTVCMTVGQPLCDRQRVGLGIPHRLGLVWWSPNYRGKLLAHHSDI